LATHSIVDEPDPGNPVADAIALSLAGLAFELAPQPERFTAERGRIAERLEAVLPELHMERAFAMAAVALYCAEMRERGSQDLASLELIAEQIQVDQNVEGGWGHDSAWDDESVYPATLIAACNSAVFALGLCRRHGVSLDEDVVEKALALLRRVQSPSGAMPYGGPTKLQLHEAGRTAGTQVALAALGEHASESYQAAVGYVRRHIEELAHGHADPHQHLFMGAIATQTTGRADWLRFRERWIDALLRHQRDDGSFECLIESCTWCNSGFDGVEPRQITATAACILSLGRSRTLSRLRPGGEAVWSRTIDAGARLRPTAEGLVGVSGDGCALFAIDPSTGEDLRRTELVLDSAAERSFTAMGVWTAGALSVVVLADLSQYVVRVDPETGEIVYPDDPVTLVCVEAGEPEPRWTHSMGLRVGDVEILPHAVAVIDGEGRLEILDRETGESLRSHRLPVPGGILAFDGSLLSAGGREFWAQLDSMIASIDASGEFGWQVYTEKHATRSRFIEPVLVGEHLVAGAMDGTVTCLDAASGARVWQVALDAAPRNAILHSEGMLVLTTGDGSALALDPRDGALLWRHEPALSAECHLGPPLVPRVAAGSIWLQDRVDGHLWRLRPEDGRPADELIAGPAELGSAPDVGWFFVQGFAIRRDGAALAGFALR